jgi:hypothetical protein
MVMIIYFLFLNKKAISPKKDGFDNKQFSMSNVNQTLIPIDFVK